MPDLLVTPQLSVPHAEFQFSDARSSGPGGQNVNKVSSKAQLRWSVTASPSIPEDVKSRFLTRFKSRITVDGEILVVSQRFRDAGRNTGDCLDKLREMLVAVASPPKRRARTKPTKSSIRRRLTAKRERSDKKRSRRGPGLEQ